MTAEFDYLGADLPVETKTKLIQENWERLKKVMQKGDLEIMPPAYRDAMRDYMTEHWDKLVSQRPPFRTYLQSLLNGGFSEYTSHYNKSDSLKSEQFTPLLKALFTVLPVEKLIKTNEEFRDELNDFANFQYKDKHLAYWLYDVTKEKKDQLKPTERQEKYRYLGYAGCCESRDLDDFIPLMPAELQPFVEKGITERITKLTDVLSQNHTWYDGYRVHSGITGETIQAPNSEELAGLIVYGLKPNRSGIGEKLFKSLLKMKSQEFTALVNYLKLPTEQEKNLRRQFRQHYFAQPEHQRTSIINDENMVGAAVICDDSQTPLAADEEKQIKKYVFSHLKRAGYNDYGERQRDYQTRELIQYLLKKKGFAATEPFLKEIKNRLRTYPDAALVRIYVENILKGMSLPNQNLVDFNSIYYSSHFS